MRKLLMLGLFCAAHAYGAETTRPNVLLIFVDDLGYCDTELYGCDTVPTPNINRLADEGVLFTDGYVSSPVCSPSRAGLLTGRHQQRFGHEFLPSTAADSTSGLPVGEVTLADAMRDAGYVTGMVGKWHLGVQKQFHPTNRGFDEFFGMTTWGADYVDPTRDDVKAIRRPGRPVPVPTGNWERDIDTVQRGTTPVAEDDYLTEAFTQEAIAFINKHKARPFFLYLPHLAVHGPLQVTQKYYDRFPHIKDESSRIYAAMTSALDDGIGEVLDALEQNGLDDNTLVIFTSDNGAGAADYCSNEPLRLGKQTMFEGGVRVPFAIKWPGKIPKGTTYEHPISTLDIFPTVLAAAGASPATDIALDGVDLMPYLSGSNSEKPHDKLFWRAGNIWATREGDWKLIYAADRHWLYDLSADIGEKTNLADKRPDRVKEMTASFEQWNRGNVEPLWPSFGTKGMPRFSVDGVNINWTF
ncbi:MAG: sulfatase [Proteobacteria bacterium]|jgi:arylsulfatase A-like enzyme|nr:sulfatase [Pseudomonadota bacterium]MBT6348088.1 sulfatase [Pseudomonadota bacterium]